MPICFSLILSERERERERLRHFGDAGKEGLKTTSLTLATYEIVINQKVKSRQVMEFISNTPLNGGTSNITERTSDKLRNG